MSPRTPVQFREIREEKRTLIMDVALEHFSTSGFHATTINHIAKHAGISKGLMYNYFRSKEDLLAAVIRRSVLEIYEYFDLNRDGHLSEEEFVFFIRSASKVLKEKKMLWRLFLQLLMENKVREEFMNHFFGGRFMTNEPEYTSEKLYLSRIPGTILEYFMKKKSYKPAGYDPHIEMNMFILTLKGFATTYLFLDKDDTFFDMTVEQIIEAYK